MSDNPISNESEMTQEHFQIMQNTILEQVVGEELHRIELLQSTIELLEQHGFTREQSLVMANTNERQLVVNEIFKLGVQLISGRSSDADDNSPEE